MMERRNFLKKAGLAGILAAGVSPMVHAEPTIRWRIASSFPKTLDTIYGGAEVFANLVNKMSGGRMQVTVHAAGELMPALEVLKGVQSRTVDAAHTAGYYFHNVHPVFAIDAAIPFGLNSRQMTSWMYQGNGMTLLRSFFAKQGVVNLPLGNTGAQMGGWFRKEITTKSDLQGLKMRCGGFPGRVLKELGVTPVTMGGGDIYPALEKGTIDAAEWVGPYDDLKLGFHKVAKNYLYPAFWEGGTQLSLYISKVSYDSLPDDLKEVVTAAASHAHVDMQAKYDARNPAALKELLTHGVKLIRMPKDVMDTAYRAAEQLYEDLSAKDPEWKKIYTDYDKFRTDEYQWFRIAEQSYDSFMMNQRAVR